MGESVSPDATQILSRASRGDAVAADQLMPLVYARLRDLAQGYLRQERPDHLLQPTALVHEAYLALVDHDRIDWQGRTHFLAVAARQMRRVLIDHARGRDAIKRGRDWARVTLSNAGLHEEIGNWEILDLEDALQELAALDARHANVVELRFFGGLTIPEAAQILDVSPKTVEKDWRVARAWLHRRLSEGAHE